MSTFWRYLKIQAFVLLCGIVGPIFLVIYFATGADPMMSWLFWGGLIITAIDILIALGMTGFGAKAAAKKPAARKPAAKPAAAKAPAKKPVTKAPAKAAAKPAPAKKRA